MSRLYVLGARAFMVMALALAVFFSAIPGNAQPNGMGQNFGNHASHMHAALHELKQARTELHESKHDYGGHREKALEAVDHAIHQLEKALKFHKGQVK
jgi:hypothetical protein